MLCIHGRHGEALLAHERSRGVQNGLRVETANQPVSGTQASVANVQIHVGREHESSQHELREGRTCDRQKIRQVRNGPRLGELPGWKP